MNPPLIFARARTVKTLVDPLRKTEVFLLEIETDQVCINLAFDDNLARTTAHALFAGARSLNQGAPT